MEKITYFLRTCGDLRISIVLFLLFAFACAAATFIESSYGTPTAWAMIYGTLWFGFIQLFLGLNLICAFFRYKMFSLKKLPMFVFHLSFLFILLGSIFTRYLGFDGLLHIRENEQNSVVESAKPFIKFSALENGNVYGIAASQDIALLPFANNFALNLKLNDKEATLKYKNLLLDAKQEFKEDTNATPLLSLMINVKDEGANEVFFEKDEIKNIAGVNFSFMNEDAPKPYVLIDENLELSSSENLQFLDMAGGKNSVLEAFKKTPSQEKRLYDLGALNFVVKYASKHAKIELVGANRPQDNSFWLWFKNLWLEAGRSLLVGAFGEPHTWKNEGLLGFKEFAMSKDYQALELGANAINALELELEYDGQRQNFYVFEHAKPVRVDLANQAFFVAWNTYTHDLGFNVYLKDFILERYAGSMSPKSYESLVEIKNNDELFDARIFMNNVLDYEGYRFYQSSYDQDELGTVLSVNKDPGKTTTYIGYTLLCLGMFLNFLNPNSRFRTLARLINKEALKSAAAVLLALFIFGNFTNEIKANENNVSQRALPQIDEDHALRFGNLVVQKFTGRMNPMDTIATEILDKVYKKQSYKDMNANAVVLSMLLNSKAWSEEKIIIMPRNKAVREEISRIMQIPVQDYVALVDFFDENRQYKLNKYVENANRKNPNSRGVFDKEIIKLDERANIVNLALSGELFRFLPKQNDENNTWLTIFDVLTKLEDQQEKIAATAILENYFTALELAIDTKDYTKANEALLIMQEYQKKYGEKIMPSESKIATEIFVNHSQIFIKLTPIYLLAGAFLLILIFAKILKPNLGIKLVFKIVYWVNVFAFIIHSLGLCLRAYIAEHAPWSNAYESMIYIAWALALSGIFFSRKSPIALALTSILAGLVLQVAHLSEMDPQITNLVPVLDSYWLTIHVSVITASYGFLGLCALLGIFVLILFCFMKKDGKLNENIQRNITEATRVNEMAMILGLCLLTIGNFLGAIWANESWGRYWSWDSKETWALISILIYAAVLHIRMIPSLCNQYNFALASMFAYWSIIMTYFGVNYFLVGLHSYAAGEATKIPNYVYYSVLLMVILAIISFFKRKFAKRL